MSDKIIVVVCLEHAIQSLAFMLNMFTKNKNQSINISL